MLTEREVLIQLKRIGIREPSLLKVYLTDFKKYMETHHGLKILKTEKQLDALFNPDSPSAR